MECGVSNVCSRLSCGSSDTKKFRRLPRLHKYIRLLPPRLTLGLPAYRLREAQGFFHRFRDLAKFEQFCEVICSFVHPRILLQKASSRENFLIAVNLKVIYFQCTKSTFRSLLSNPFVSCHQRIVC